MPGTAIAQYRNDPVEDQTHLPTMQMPTWPGKGNQRLEDGPCASGQIAWKQYDWGHHLLPHSLHHPPYFILHSLYILFLAYSLGRRLVNVPRLQMSS